LAEMEGGLEHWLLIRLVLKEYHIFGLLFEQLQTMIWTKSISIIFVQIVI